jgi:hypothetical protein
VRHHTGRYEASASPSLRCAAGSAPAAHSPASSTGECLINAVASSDARFCEHVKASGITFGLPVLDVTLRPISRQSYWLFSFVRSRNELNIRLTSSGFGWPVSQRAWNL